MVDPAKRPQTVAALVDVVDAEVNSKSGLSGTALKGAYKAAQKIDSTIVSRAIDKMLPDFIYRLDRYWDAKGDQPFGQYLASQGEDVANTLLEVTDQRAANPNNAAVAKVYNMVRGKAKENVVAALPRLGTALEGLAT